MRDKNPLGGGNPNSLYVPMSETEQEVIDRLIQSDDLLIEVHGWGTVYQPRVTLGDLRLTCTFRLDFDRPEPPGVSVFWFDLELKTRAGLSLFGPDRLPTVYDNKPIQVAAGMYYDLAWDIAIQKIDPKIVKMLKPAAIGFTSAEGNRNLNPRLKKLYQHVRAGEAKVRQFDQQQAAKAVRRSQAKPKT